MSNHFPAISREAELSAFVSRKGYPGVFYGLSRTPDIEMLPSDAEHLFKHLQPHRSDLYRDIVAGYVQAWRDGSKAEPRALQKQGAGRRNANSWIRNYQSRDER